MSQAQRTARLLSFIRSDDPIAVNGGRDQVTAEDIDLFIERYWSTESWAEKINIIELTQDHADPTPPPDQPPQVERAIADGADPSAVMGDGDYVTCSALALASMNGHEDLVLRLLQAGAEINHRPTGHVADFCHGRQSERLHDVLVAARARLPVSN